MQGKQFDVLEYLINSKNTIITKDQIFDKIWGFDSDTSTNVIEVYTSRIKKRTKESWIWQIFKNNKRSSVIFGVKNKGEDLTHEWTKNIENSTL